MSFSHSRFKRNKSSVTRKMTKKEKMANTDLQNFNGWNSCNNYFWWIYGNLVAIILISIPLDRMRGHFNGIIGSSDPDAIRAHLIAIQIDLDNSFRKTTYRQQTTHGEVIGKNPVWMFPTESTNFLRIQNDVDYHAYKY